ncbi:unnamed protein product [Paramecium octaurelia]|uniref:Uncharacterized protein n=1 Tax=Paramecium octaurelia TaxID=43137 RepID=A0A8S1XDG0_PAROT|nr:unnamed protein product [Paramecium octaurelia]
MDINLGEIFIPNDYTLTEFKYQDIEIQIYSLNSGSTDFDLTGQIIWPASIELTKFIIDNNQLFKDKNVLELGAGAGLCGFVAAKYAKNVIITDGNQIVQDLITKNIEHLKLKNVQGSLFQWGYENSKAFKDIDIIIGADIIFWPQSIVPLYETVKYFNEQNENIQMFVSGIKRYQQTEDEIDNLLTSIKRPRVLIKQINDYKQIVYIYKL